MNLANIASQVELVATLNNHRVVELAQKVLEQHKLDCSYALYLDIYSYFNRRLCKAKRDPFHISILTVQRELEECRDKLYSNPCHICDTCKRRRKPWPT